MNIADAIRRIAELSDIGAEYVGLGEAMYRLGRINELARMTASAAVETTIALCPPSVPQGNEPSAAPNRKARYVRAADIMDYIWSREGSVRMEYLLHDLYHDRKGAEKQAVTTLSRMKSLADVTLDRDENGRIVVVTARRMLKD